MFSIDILLLIIMHACKLTSPPQWQCRHVWSRVPTLKTSELATVLEVNLYGVIFSFHHVISIGQGVIWLLPATATKVPALVCPVGCLTPLRLPLLCIFCVAGVHEFGFEWYCKVEGAMETPRRYSLPRNRAFSTT